MEKLASVWKKQHMKVAHVLPWVSRHAGGLLGAVSGLARGLGNLGGLEVGVFGTQDDYSEEDASHWKPLLVHTTAAVGPARLSFTPGMRKQLEVFNPDLVHSCAVWTYQAAIVNRWHEQRQKPYVLSTHGTLDPWALGRSRWKKAIALRWFQQKHFQNAACIHALNESEVASIRKYGLKNPVCVIPNGIDIPEIGRRKAESEKESAVGDQRSEPSQLKAEGRKILLYLGRIHPKKGLVNLLKAWAAVQASRPSPLAPRHPEWVLAIAGWDEGGHEAELKRLAAELGIPFTDARESAPSPPRSGQGEVLLLSSILHPPSSIVFLGPQFGEAKAACYRASDAFILPSFSEGLPMVVLEAWAYGKPVLMTPACNLPEGFTANAALRIETNPESIAAGLKEMCRLADFASPLRLNRGEGQGAVSKLPPCSALCTLGANGRKLVEDRFAWPSIAREMKSVYEWVLGGGPEPGCVTLD